MNNFMFLTPLACLMCRSLRHLPEHVEARVLEQACQPWLFLVPYREAHRLHNLQIEHIQLVLGAFYLGETHSRLQMHRMPLSTRTWHPRSSSCPMLTMPERSL